MNSKKNIVFIVLIFSILLPVIFVFAENDFEKNSVLLLKQTEKEIADKSDGCRSCHIEMDTASMHKSPAVRLGCTDCHGGDSSVSVDKEVALESTEYSRLKDMAHVLPKDKSVWKSSANPKSTYTALLKESAEFVKFVNPGDLRVAEETCGGCHSSQVERVKKSLMTTSAAFWASAAYNNGIIEDKRAQFGESYTRDGLAACVETIPGPTQKEIEEKGVIPKLSPLPRWEVVKPGDNFRVFEDGGILNPSTFPDFGNPTSFEDPGRPDIRQSNRGLGTGLRISVPILNVHKTRLNDPHLSFMGTNDNPGDYRSSGCSGCHVLYSNDRDPFHSGFISKFGNTGTTITVDPTIPKDESGHPLKHEFTNSIPSSQCIVCHMHQPNVFVNTFLGYTMWDYETDGELMWPEKQKYPTDEEKWKVYRRNPEGAAVKGLWSDPEFLEDVSTLNPKAKHTQFADYHGHGWNFRAVFKRDKKGNLLDTKDNVIPFDEIDGEKLNRAITETTENSDERKGIPVHLKDIHLEKGMHCVDCHFEQDNHGNGQLHGEYANEIEIACRDCHGTINQEATLKTSGVAAPEGGNDLSLDMTPFGKFRFYREERNLYQRSSLDKNQVWKVVQVKDTVNPVSSDYNEKSRLAKTIKRDGKTWGNISQNDIDLAHSDEDMECFTCHTSWTTACAGCHLPIEANWKVKSKHFEGTKSRNWSSYNPQTVRTDQFMLGVHGTTKGNKIAPIRSSSALVVSSTNVNRERIYIQQPPMSSAGYSSQAFNPHFPHTVRTDETKTCTDCHISDENNNNAWMQSLLGQGTNFVNFIGRNAWVAIGKGGVEAVNVTEWDEPQAVIGSYLHKLAYPDFYKEHIERERKLDNAYHHSGENILDLQLRGEYLYTANGPGGFQVFDVANVDNKGFSERIVTSPVSPLGQDTKVNTKYATAVGLPTTMPVDPTRCYRVQRGGKPLKPEETLPDELCKPENNEQKMHELYRYAFITDKYEGLIVVNVDTLSDREPRNNFLKRTATFNPDGKLDGANNITVAGNYAYITAAAGLVIVNIEEPKSPQITSVVDNTFLQNPRSIEVQFRYAFVLDDKGMNTVDITDPKYPKYISNAVTKIEEPHNIYVARTYAYVAAGKDGLVIVDIENPEKPFVDQVFNADGKINDARDVKIGTTNASLFAYIADGKNGLRVVQLTSPEKTPAYYGFSPKPAPELIASMHTKKPAVAISKGLDRDRAVDESGNQVSIFGRIGSRPFNSEEMKNLYMKDGKVYKVSDSPPQKPLPYKEIKTVNKK